MPKVPRSNQLQDDMSGDARRERDTKLEHFRNWLVEQDQARRDEDGVLSRLAVVERRLEELECVMHVLEYGVQAVER